jgi:hypothetical protein
VPCNEGEDIREPPPSNDVDLDGEGQNVTVLQANASLPPFETPVGHVHHGSNEEGTPSNDDPQLRQ